MSRTAKFRFSHTRKIDSAFRYVSEAADAGAILRTGQGPNGRHVTVDGVRLMNFGSCSYMGLEVLPEIRECAHRAIDEYGTQFHFSRAYLQCELYAELEALLEQDRGPPHPRGGLDEPRAHGCPAGAHHGRGLPPRRSVRPCEASTPRCTCSPKCRWRDRPACNRMDSASEARRLAHLRGKAQKVWYIADGLYSMLKEISLRSKSWKRLLNEYDNLRLYIDDAHSTSWLGARGRGAALDHFADDERVVVTLSLNKAFSAAGGLLALPTRELVDRVRRCGGPILFSGPIQPPMLGAAVGSGACAREQGISLRCRPS